MEPLLLAHEGCNALGHPDPFSFAELLAKLNRHAAEMGGARIEGLIDTMPDAHDLFLVGERILNPGIDF